MADILTEFQTKLNNFPKNSNDFNIICSITYAEYTTMVTILNTLLLPQQMINRELIKAVVLLNDETYKTLSEGLSKLNLVLKSVLPSPLNKNMTMTFDIGRVGDLLTQTCADFLGSIPESLFNVFQDIKHGITSLSNISNNIFNLPYNLSNNIARSLLQLKDKMLLEFFGGLHSTVLLPFIEYENFLLDNGIMLMINKIHKIEQCMSKPGICNRSREDFIYKNTKLLNSDYFKSQFFYESKRFIEYYFSY